MILQLFKSLRRTVLIDINTQRDLFVAGSHRCVRNHRRILRHIRRIVAWARHFHIPLISTCEVHPGTKNLEIISDRPDRSNGQSKIQYTLLSNRATFLADDNTDLPIDVLLKRRQVVLHCRCADPFDEPKIERLLSELKADMFVLIGAYTEEAVEAAALGLLQRGKKVTVVFDCVGSRNKKAAKLAIRKMKAKGAKIVETRKLVGSSHLHHVSVCGCEKCSTANQPEAVK